MTKKIMYRLIADEGKMLTDGNTCGKVIDLSPDADENKWREISDEDAAELIAEKQRIIDIITGEG